MDRRGFIKIFGTSVASLPVLGALTKGEPKEASLEKQPSLETARHYKSSTMLSAMPAGNRIAVHVDPCEHCILEGRSNTSPWEIIYSISPVGANIWLAKGEYTHLRLSRQTTFKKRKRIDQISLNFD